MPSCLCRMSDGGQWLISCNGNTETKSGVDLQASGRRLSSFGPQPDARSGRPVVRRRPCDMCSGQINGGGEVLTAGLCATTSKCFRCVGPASWRSTTPRPSVRPLYPASGVPTSVYAKGRASIKHRTKGTRHRRNRLRALPDTAVSNRPNCARLEHPGESSTITVGTTERRAQIASSCAATSAVAVLLQDR
ncbi:hypothetical protein BD310DRAFT_910688 [Dichomitus squalens]|uniref:Uncharacterized protein n=1 Tax=Dichomitus squalens TaxID=114155 RepID=A0A4Q9PAD4_9APHY|nr:hypothetical protein BD310DRAFT_910688 [Dichomitus squalens]